MRRPNPGERSSLPAYLLALLASLLFVNQHQTLPKLRDFVIDRNLIAEMIAGEAALRAETELI